MGARASSETLVGFLGLRSLLFPGTGVMAMASSPGKKTDLDDGQLKYQL